MKKPAQNRKKALMETTFFPLSLPSFTPSLPNFVTYPQCFLTACKMTSHPSVLAWASDSKHPDLYYSSPGDDHSLNLSCFFLGLLYLRSDFRPLHLSPEEAVHREECQRPPLSAGHHDPGEMLSHFTNQEIKTTFETVSIIQNLSHQLHDELGPDFSRKTAIKINANPVNQVPL